jgi:hypothetical protein
MWVPRLLSFVFLLTGAHAEVIDRIAVTLDNQVITQSEILLEIRLTAFLNGDSLDFSTESRKKAADRLVEQKLIRKEMEPAQDLEAGPAELQSMLRSIAPHWENTASPRRIWKLICSGRPHSCILSTYDFDRESRSPTMRYGNTSINSYPTYRRKPVAITPSLLAIFATSSNKA